MERLNCCIFTGFALFITVIAKTTSETQVYRFAVRDVFKNPEYLSYTECGVKTCTKYKAKCLEDGNCCMCRCNFGFPTFNVSETRCLSDETLLSESSFRFIRNDKLQATIPIIKLTDAKNLGKIIAIKGTPALKKCKMVHSESYYWADRPSEDWIPLLQPSKNNMFRIRTTKNDVTLQWVYPNSTKSSWFHGQVFRLSIQCVGIESTIIFKSKKNYNENGYIGCLSSHKATTLLTNTFTCSTMTPNMCKDFCRRRGYSVAMLKRRTQCSCTDNTEVMSWNEIKFSCSLPCGGEKEKFCGGKETFSAYRTIPEWPDDFKFSSHGTSNSSEYRCTKITQPNTRTAWNSTYFCAKKIGTNIKLSWFSQEPRKRILAKRRCIAINKTSNSSSWEDNFLCVEKEVGLRFTWSYSGKVYGMKCLQMEAEMPLGWKDNYLCAARTKENKREVSILCPNTDVPPPDDPTMTLLLPSPSTMTPHTQQTYRQTETHTLRHRSENLPSHSTISNSVSNQGPNKKDKNHKTKELIPLYIFLTLACVLGIVTVGVFTLLYLRKRMKTKKRLSTAARNIHFDNPAWPTDKETLDGQKPQETKRKSRKDRLPSLPALAPETCPPESLNASPETQYTLPQTPNTQQETNNSTHVPTLAAIAKVRSKTLDMDSDGYAEIPMASNVCPVHPYESGDQCNAATHSVDNIDNSLGNPTYESVDNFHLNADTIYLEVLP